MEALLARARTRSCTTVLIVLVAVIALGLHQSAPKTGWLDRLVQYHKERFINELRKVKSYTPNTASTTIESTPFNATLLPRPAGFVDSGEWNFDSVMRLMIMLKSSEAAKPTLRTLRRMLQPTRRIMMSMKESMQKFPGLNAESNDIYYEIEYTSQEDSVPAPESPPEDQVVVVVSNPVEARLPSTRISVQLLREILIARARAARQMPPTKPPVIPWKPMKSTTTTAKSASQASSSAPGESTPQPEGESSPGGESESTPEGEGEAGSIPEGEAESPPEGEGEANSPPEGEGEANSPPEGEGEANSPPEGEGEPNSPPEGEGEPNSPPEGEGEPNSPPEGEGEPNSPPEGEGEPNSPPEGEPGT
ncbi:unnamed protein product [Spodoptera littoralis]|uniref:Uncharacterized protein n=1 Tax=Spodoptera littoralis TaxID=7109 RepID=A0A9P0MXF9_SPOLI|nr:unnamed protein product [Spodoptera littoralis]CAH1634832.1 unnamed protein product [Spodoptera littoralis]